MVDTFGRTNRGLARMLLACGMKQLVANICKLLARAAHGGGLSIVPLLQSATVSVLNLCGSKIAGHNFGQGGGRPADLLFRATLLLSLH